MSSADDTPLLCHRCGSELRSGAGSFYIVRIEAVADPTPPAITRADLEQADLDAEFSRLLERMRGMAEQELKDQVYRRMTIHLCVPCYRTWIENPAG